jgi:hypothetical protein
MEIDVTAGPALDQVPGTGSAAIFEIRRSHHQAPGLGSAQETSAVLTSVAPGRWLRAFSLRKGIHDRAGDATEAVAGTHAWAQSILSRMTG